MMTSKLCFMIAVIASLWIGPASAQENPQLKKLLDRCAAGDQRSLAPLAQFGPAAAPAVPSIIAMMKQSPSGPDAAMRQWGVKVEAVRTLSAIGAAAKPALPQIVAYMESPMPEEDRAIALQECTTALAAIGPEARSTAPKLQALTQNADQHVAMAAHIALAAILDSRKELDFIAATMQQGNQDEMKALLDCLVAANIRLNFTASEIKAFINSSNGVVYSFGTTVAMAHPEMAGELAPLLLTGFTRSDAMQDGLTTKAFVALGEAAVPPLIAGVQGKFDAGMPNLEKLVASRDHIQWQSAITMAEMGPAAKAAAPVLIPMLKEKKGTRVAVIRALAEMGEAAKPAIPDLQAIADSGDNGPNQNAAVWANYALYRLGVDRAARLQAIVNRLGYTGYDRSPNDILKKIGTDCIPVLIARFGEVKDKTNAAEQVSSALMSFGTDARSALPTLHAYMKETVNDKSVSVGYLRSRVKSDIFQIESAIREEQGISEAPGTRYELPADEEAPPKYPAPQSPYGKITPVQTLAPEELPAAVTNLVKADLPNDRMTTVRLTAAEGSGYSIYRVVLHHAAPEGDRAMEVWIDRNGEPMSTMAYLFKEEVPQAVMDGAKQNAAGGELRPDIAKALNTLPAMQFMARRTVTYILNGKKLDKPTYAYLVMLQRGKDPGSVVVDGEGKVVTAARYFPAAKPKPAPQPSTPKEQSGKQP